jgi:hypothetical protein
MITLSGRGRYPDTHSPRIFSTSGLVKRASRTIGVYDNDYWDFHW